MTKATPPDVRSELADRLANHACFDNDMRKDLLEAVAILRTHSQGAGREAIARIIDPSTMAAYDDAVKDNRLAANGESWADVAFGSHRDKLFAKADAILSLTTAAQPETREPTDEQLTEWVQWLDWDTGLSTAQEIKQLRSLLKRIAATPEASPPQQDVREQIELDGFDRGVQHTVELLAKWLAVTDYEGADGSEEHDTDLGNTLLNILAAKGLYNKDEGTFASLSPVQPDVRASLDGETIQTLLDLLNPLHGELDRQTYDERLRENFDAPRDAEYSVNITAQMERDLTQAVLILEKRRAASPDVRARTIEECAKVLDSAAQDWRRIRDPGMANNAASYARKIRALSPVAAQSGETAVSADERANFAGGK